MTNKTDVASTPKYVLKSGGQPLCAMLNLDDPKTSCKCVYGFSDKAIYDQFIQNAKQPLTPYPLVPGYLANQIAEAELAGMDGVRTGLVILDATDPAQPVVSAATMAAVLDTQQQQAKQVSIELELSFDAAAGSYLKHDSKQAPVAPA